MTRRTACSGYDPWFGGDPLSPDEIRPGVVLHPETSCEHDWLVYSNLDKAIEAHPPGWRVVEVGKWRTAFITEEGLTRYHIKRQP